MHVRLGGSGGMVPGRKLFEIRCSEIASQAILSQKQSRSSYMARRVPYLLDQTPRLHFISSRNFVRLLFESGYKSRAAFIKLSVIGKTFVKCKGFEKSRFCKINKELRYGDLVLKQTFQLLDQPPLCYKAVPTLRYCIQFLAVNTCIC